MKVHPAHDCKCTPERHVASETNRGPQNRSRGCGPLAPPPRQPENLAAKCVVDGSGSFGFDTTCG